MRLTRMSLAAITDIQWCDIVSNDQRKADVLTQIGLTENDIREIEAHLDPEESIFEMFFEAMDTETGKATYSICFNLNTYSRKKPWEAEFSLDMKDLLEEWENDHPGWNDSFSPS